MSTSHGLLILGLLWTLLGVSGCSDDSSGDEPLSPTTDTTMDADSGDGGSADIPLDAEPLPGGKTSR